MAGWGNASMTSTVVSMADLAELLHSLNLIIWLLNIESLSSEAYKWYIVTMVILHVQTVDSAHDAENTALTLEGIRFFFLFWNPMSNHDLGTQIWFTSNTMLQHSNNYMKILE